MNIFQKLSAKSQIAFGQCGLLVSLLLVAVMLGLVPDRFGAIREGRASLAEALAANSAAFITYSDIKRIEADLDLVVHRNADLLSAGLRREDGSLAVAIADHEQRWLSMEGDYSSDTQLRVPIRTGEQRWGEIELRYTPLKADGILGALQTPWIQLTLFLSLFSFIAFYFYLGKMLTQLDPSQAIPGRVRSALDTMAEGLLVLDRKQHIVLANRAFADLLGKKADDLTGLKADLLPWIATGKELDSVFDYPWVRAMKEGVAQTNSIIRLQLTGKLQRTFMINCSPVMGSNGKYAGVLVSFDDITELEEKEIELRKSKDEAEAANAAKSVFLSNMSHEIRTPMNAVLGFTEILQRGYSKDAKTSARHLRTIHSSGKHLLNLINDILDLSKVESGHMEIEKIRFAAHEVIAETVNVLNVKAQEKNIELRFLPHGDLPESILSDPSRFRQIITNLVGNAIKFTDSGSVTVALHMDDITRQVLRVDVIDTGIGMAQDRLDAIFDPFVQADNSVSRRFGGTGLGLSISKRFAEALGGAITVTSTPGQGSTFSVNIGTGSLEGISLLPAERLLQQVQQSSELESGAWKFPTARILVVDDGDENRELIRLVLEQHDLTVDEAANGKEGVEKATTVDYDVILMDVQMPVMDGFTAATKLREQKLETPIIAMTANAMKGFEEECIAAGYSGYMSKPIDIDTLLARLAALLGAEKMAAGAADFSAANSAKVCSDDDSRSVVIRSQLAEKDARFSHLIDRFRDKLNSELTDAAISWQTEEYTKLELFAHWLKGAGGTVGFGVFTEPADRLEQAARLKADTQIDAQLAAIRQLTERLENAKFVKSAASNDADYAQTELSPDSIGNAQVSPASVVSRFANEPRIQPLIWQFSERLEERLREMHVLLEEEKFAQLKDIAHWLKGAGGTIGFDAFTQPADELERLADVADAAGVALALRQVQMLADSIYLTDTHANERQQKTGGIS